jgi:DNA invertase Pin-like site-specific DNA recombinase
VKIIAYARVSTEEQAIHGVSLAAQEQKLRAYSQLYGHDLIDMVIDAGQSAKSLNREGLQSALLSLKSGRAEGLLVLRLDRLTRSVRDLGTLLDTYFQKCALLSVQEQFDTASAAGRLVLNVMACLSQWERECNSERTSTALQFKKSQGIKLGAPALADEAVIARMKELRAEEFTLAAIAERLTQEGFRTKRGGQWYAGTVQKVLRREGMGYCV